MNVKRENRILETILKDADSPENQSQAWYQYLKDTLQFPFVATYQTRSGVRPLCSSARVHVIGLCRPEACHPTIHVRVMDGISSLRIPLTDLSVPDKAAPNAALLDDWRYWHARHIEGA